MKGLNSPCRNPATLIPRPSAVVSFDSFHLYEIANFSHALASTLIDSRKRGRHCLYRPISHIFERFQ